IGSLTARCCDGRPLRRAPPGQRRGRRASSARTVVSPARPEVAPRAERFAEDARAIVGRRRAVPPLACLLGPPGLSPGAGASGVRGRDWRPHHPPHHRRLPAGAAPVLGGAAEPASLAVRSPALDLSAPAARHVRTASSRLVTPLERPARRRADLAGSS